jgi:hypothetical protein
MTDADNLRNQIERAKRFAASMTSETERIRFEKMASEFQRELQLVEARQPVMTNAPPLAISWQPNGSHLDPPRADI